MFYHQQPVKGLPWNRYQFPFVSRTETSACLLLALVKGATEYLCDGFKAQDKGGVKDKRVWGRVGGRPEGAREGGELTGRKGLGDGRNLERSG